MWKALLSSGQQATRTIQHLRPASSVHVSSESARPFSLTAQLRKDDPTDINDRHSLTPERSEVAKSGTDSEVAEHPSAWDPNNTDPERELEATQEENQRAGKHGSPLNMSPANKEASAWRGPTEGGADRNADRQVSSAKGRPNKKRAIHVKEDGTHVSYRE